MVARRGLRRGEKRHTLSRDSRRLAAREATKVGKGLSTVRKELAPSRVMIRCPVTGRAIPTGHLGDLGTVARSCPDCEQVHAWSKSDTYLERSGGMSRGLDRPHHGHQ
jgi:hypothetical protein